MAVYLPPLSAVNTEKLAEISSALQALERLFPGCDIRVELSEAEEQEIISSIRHRVIHATGKPTTANEIAAATGLDKKQVRGVLNAPDLHFKKSLTEGVVHYEFVYADRDEPVE
ncbi:MAG: hypothetical protein ACKVP0_00940 [Pirellulaceae bacterium]